eukprot:scaffold128516_cov60-Phaeocystis_antarctica.AAC.2
MAIADGIPPKGRRRRYGDCPDAHTKGNRRSARVRPVQLLAFAPFSHLSFHAIYPSSTVGKFSTGGAGRNLGIKKCAYFARPAWAGWYWHHSVTACLRLPRPCRHTLAGAYV